jgi:hypothetical protein
VAILAVVAVAGSAVGVMIYQLTQKDKPTADSAGFDIAKTQESHSAQDTAQTTAGSAMQTDRTMFQAEDLDSFADSWHKAEGSVRTMAIAYTKRYPSIAQYGRDWMRYPDLRKIAFDYQRDHDPIAFLRGMAASKNFGKLVVKYAGDPALQSFVKESITKAPGDMTSSVMGFLKEDNTIKKVVSNVTEALGLPPAMTMGILGGGKVDQNQVMGNIMQGNPSLQGAMQDPNVQNALPQSAPASGRH